MSSPSPRTWPERSSFANRSPSAGVSPALALLSFDSRNRDGGAWRTATNRLGDANEYEPFAVRYTSGRYEALIRGQDYSPRARPLTACSATATRPWAA